MNEGHAPYTTFHLHAVTTPGCYGKNEGHSREREGEGEEGREEKRERTSENLEISAY